jgi:heme o synthase
VDESDGSLVPHYYLLMRSSPVAHAARPENFLSRGHATAQSLVMQLATMHSQVFGLVKEKLPVPGGPTGRGAGRDAVRGPTLRELKPGGLRLAGVIEEKSAGGPEGDEQEPRRTRDHRAFYELAKPRITLLVTMTAGMGLMLALSGRSFEMVPMVLMVFACLTGTALSSSGANALNQWMEVPRDAAMHRTAKRPLPSGRIQRREALAFGIMTSLTGVGLLWAMCGAAAALVSLVTILSYVLVYTPSKSRTIWNTLIGAVPGALPPLIGWCAGRALVDGSGAARWASLTEAGGWSLFALMAVWQIPHFLAIAWTYREDYARGGFRMLPIVDGSGRLTAVVSLIGATLLIPATLWPAIVMPGVLGSGYATVALLSGVGFLVLCVKQARERTSGACRRVFLASIAHLPILLAAMVIEASVRHVW